MATCKEFSFKNGRSQTLHCYSFAHTNEAPPAVLFWHPGLGDHAGRYQEMLMKLSNATGFAIYTYDAHGHGKSEPKDEKHRCFIEHFEDLVDDAIQYISEVVTVEVPGKPLFIGGQSMGGLTAATTLVKYQQRFSGLILTAAAIDVEWTTLLKCQAAVGGCLAACVPFAQVVPAVRAEDMSCTAEMIKKFNEDPLIFKGKARSRTANEILKAMKALAPKYPEITVPLFVTHGTCDKCTSSKASKRLLDAASSTSKTWLSIEGGFHEMMLEDDACHQNLISWLKAQAAEGPGGTKGGAEGAGVRAADIKVTMPGA